MKTILIIDDDERIRALLKKFLEKNSFNVIDYDNGFDILEKVKNVDLIVLDIMMPSIIGTDLVKKLRDFNIYTPIILLSAKSDVNDKIFGLELGANDYVTKPFEPRELLLRINNLLNRKNNIIHFGTITYDTARSLLIDGETAIQLSSTENIIFKLLAENLNKTFTREYIVDMLDVKISERSVDVLINRIRKKLGKNCGFLQTVRHNGYMLVSD